MSLGAENVSQMNDSEEAGGEDSDEEMSSSGMERSKKARAPNTTSLEDIEKGLHYLNELN
jgi:hypothetical protein